MKKTIRNIGAAAVIAGTAVCFGVMMKNKLEKEKAELKRHTLECTFYHDDQLSAERAVQNELKDILKKEGFVENFRCVDAVIIDTAKEDGTLVGTNDYNFTFRFDIVTTLNADETIEKLYNVGDGCLLKISGDKEEELEL